LPYYTYAIKNRKKLINIMCVWLKREGEVIVQLREKIKTRLCTRVRIRVNERLRLSVRATSILSVS
jgi:hypothetical protein